MTLTIDDLYIDGVKMPPPALNGVEISYEPLWSANSGRMGSTGNFNGTLIAMKTTVKMKWAVIPFADAAKLKNAVVNLTPTHTLRLCNESGYDTTLTVYFGPPTFPIYSYAEGIQWVDGIKVDAVEV